MGQRIINTRNRSACIYQSHSRYRCWHRLSLLEQLLSKSFRQANHYLDTWSSLLKSSLRRDLDYLAARHFSLSVKLDV